MREKKISILSHFIEKISYAACVGPGITPANFVLMPLAGLPGQTPQLESWHQLLYQEAFARAQAVARPSLLERDLLGVWN